MVGGALAAANGARFGVTLGLIVGPGGAVLGGLTGAMLGALSGGIAGCATGALLGDMVDESILDNFQCLECGYTFSSTENKMTVSFEEAQL
tara:strand:+ start:219 stop:491 length:273 start_codon:yes stop_codon:yes gene_type:complete